MLPDERYISIEEAARQIEVQPITLRHWLAVGTMPYVEGEATGYVLQEDVDAFNEACQCRNQRIAAQRQLVHAVAS